MVRFSNSLLTPPLVIFRRLSAVSPLFPHFSAFLPISCLFPLPSACLPQGPRSRIGHPSDSPPKSRQQTRVSPCEPRTRVPVTVALCRERQRLVSASECFGASRSRRACTIGGKKASPRHVSRLACSLTDAFSTALKKRNRIEESTGPRPDRKNALWDKRQKKKKR